MQLIKACENVAREGVHHWSATYQRRHWWMAAAIMMWSSLAHSHISHCFSSSRSVMHSLIVFSYVYLDQILCRWCWIILLAGDDLLIACSYTNMTDLLKEFIFYASCRWFMCGLQLKEKVAVKFNVLLEQICLIHSGKILDDGDALSSHAIVDDTVVHMVVKSAGSQVYYYLSLIHIWRCRRRG